eukprot:jgi/Botrbrau1/52/Bobra.0022s0046.1
MPNKPSVQQSRMKGSGTARGRVRQPVRGPYGDWASHAGPVKYLERHSGNPHVLQRLQGLFTGRHPRLTCKAIRVPRQKIGVGKGNLRGWRTPLKTMILS